MHCIFWESVMNVLYKYKNWYITSTHFTTFSYMMQTLLLHYKDESRKGAAISLLQIYASLFFRIVCNNTFVIFQKNIIRNGISY